MSPEDPDDLVGNVKLVAPSRADRSREHLARVWRSIPVFGIGAHLGYREDRLGRQRNSDAAYRQLMEEMGAVPRMPNLSEKRERHVMAGELAGYVSATGIGLALYFMTRDLRTAWFATWILGLVGDWLGGTIGGWICDKKHPFEMPVR